MRFIPPLLLSLLPLSAAGPLALFDPLDAISRSQVHMKLDAFAADDPVSLRDLLNGWHGPYRYRNGENLAIDDARFDIGASFENSAYIGYTYRHHSITKASDDSTLLVWQQLNDEPFEAGKIYDLYIGIELFEGDGVVCAFPVPLPSSMKSAGVEMAIGMELLRGRNMQDGYLKGYAVANSDRDYDYSAVADYYYTENYLYNLDVLQAEGYGFTTHLSFKIEGERTVFRAIVNDLYGRIFWKELPYSYVFISSSTKKYDENGYVVYNPAVSGVEKYVDYTQKLYPKYRLEGKYGIDSFSCIAIGADGIKRRVLPYAGYTYRFGPDAETTISYESRFDSFGLSIRYKNTLVAFRSDSLRHPAALGATLSYSVRF